MYGPTILGVLMVIWLVQDWVRFERKIKEIERGGRR